MKKDEKAAKPPKRPYAKPVLKIFGTVDKLTAAGSAAPMEIQSGNKSSFP